MAARPPLLDAWRRLLLTITTRRWRPSVDLTADMLAQVEAARALEWRFRRASPRYDLIWSNDIGLCRRLRVVVLPDRAARLSRSEFEAVLRRRMARCGASPASSSKDLPAKARLKLRAALAPAWLGPGAALDLFAEEDADEHRSQGFE